MPARILPHLPLYLVAAIHTDALGRSQVKITLGSTVTRGLGAGGKPEVGQAAATESLPEIEEALADADMVFVTAGEVFFCTLDLTPSSHQSILSRRKQRRTWLDYGAAWERFSA